MANETDPQQITVHVGADSYLVANDGAELQVGRQVGDTVLWQDETVPVEQLPAGARAALESGDMGSEDLQRALEAIVEAFAQRGG